MLVKVITTISSIEIQMIEKKSSFTDLLCFCLQHFSVCDCVVYNYTVKAR